MANKKLDAKTLATLRALPLDTLRAEAMLPQRVEADRVWVEAVLAELRRRGAA